MRRLRSRKTWLLGAWMMLLALPSLAHEPAVSAPASSSTQTLVEELTRALTVTTTERDALASELEVARAKVRLLEARLSERDQEREVCRTQLAVEHAKRKSFWEDHIRICTGVGAAYNPITGTADGGFVGVLGWAW